MARTGRPREFDRDAAVNAAMLLFWEQGFESTSLSQLRAAMGDISAASFYAAFESKEALFREVVERYIATHGQVSEHFRNEELRPREAIEKGLTASARMQTDGTHPLGCLLVLSAATCSPEHEHIQRLLAAERDTTRSWIQACIQRGKNMGDISADADVNTLTTLFDTFLRGISTQARDGVPLASIEQAISQLMSVWDALSSGKR